jgi:hypothetical protein
MRREATPTKEEPRQGVWAGALYILPAEHGVAGRLFAQRAKRSFVPGTQTNRVELFLISAQDPAGLPMDHVDLPAS